MPTWPLRPVEAVATYHDACHLVHGRGSGARPAPSRADPRLRLVELPESDLCCGSAGVYNLLEPRWPIGCSSARSDNIAAPAPRCSWPATRAACSRSRGVPGARLVVEVLHPVEVLARAVGP